MNEQLTIFEPGEGLLIAGLLVLLISAYLLPQVMLGLLAFLTGPLALIFLFCGVVRAREGAYSIARQATGFLLLLLAIGGLFAGTIVAADTGAREARLAQIRQANIQNATPTAPDTAAPVGADVQGLASPEGRTPDVHWAVKLDSRLAPVFMGFGLLCWTGWSFWRCLTWAGVVLLMLPAVRHLIHTLGPRMVLSA